MSLGGFDYAHMCRDEHVQIGHNDSSHERCPLCRANDMVRDLTEALQDCVALGVAHVGSYRANNGLEEYHPLHREIINRAQRLLGGRELPPK